MQFYLVISFFAVIVSVHTAVLFPSNPEINNQNDVEENHQIWMAAEKSAPTLEDRNRPITGLNVTIEESINYWLYTRNNRYKADILVYNDSKSVSESNYIYGQPLNVIVHGWQNDGNQRVNTLITAALLDTLDVNVVVLDWGNKAKLPYNLAAEAVPSVGNQLGMFLVWLLKRVGTSLDDMHMIGHSLGAHIGGIAGRYANGRFGRMTGLDPAGPLWWNNTNALNTSSAVYVETINTDGKLFGYFYPLGHANFYPNGGRHPQPGCLANTCSHDRAFEFFADTVRVNDKVGKKCNNIKEAEKNECNGEELLMGNSVLPKRGKGIFSLSLKRERG